MLELNILNTRIILMGNLHKKETGFSAVETILILAIVALIGALGYMVYRNHNSAKTSLVATTTKTAVNPYAGWKTYSSNGTSLKYPANWIIGTDPNEGGGTTVSSVVNPIQVVRPTQPARPQYNNKLALDIIKGPHSNLYSGTRNVRPLDGSMILQSNLKTNGSIYCLIGSNGTNKNNQTVIGVSKCDSSAKTWEYETNASNNTTITLAIVSAGNGSSATVPIALNNSDLATIKLILKSMKF
ncbi:MAG TPA: hypothetical protein VII55_03125 [Candidatus Saccharimonadales bacterium]